MRESGTPELARALATRLVDRRRIAIVLVAAIVLATGAGVVFLEEEPGFGTLSLGTDEEADQEYVESTFDSGIGEQEVAQIVVRDENVFEKETLIRTLELQQSIQENDTIGPTLDDQRQTTGIANVLAKAAFEYQQQEEASPNRNLTAESLTLEQQRATLERLNQRQIDALVERVLDGDQGQSDAFVFLPDSYEPGTSTASATMLVVFQSIEGEYPGSAAPEEVVASHLAIQSLGAESPLETTVIGNGIITDEEERALGDTVRLVGPVALLLVVGILALAYRDILDVVLGTTGIVLVLLWTFGTLGWLGIAFNPILVAVPVLLIGLSIDFCIHVFMRYREERNHSEPDHRDRSAIPTAMSAGLAGVGAALFWVTLTTTIGFLSNLASPMQPIRNLGLVAAIGIVGSFVVFVLLLPPLKVELDGSLDRLGFDRRKPPIGTGGGRTARVLGAGVTVAREMPAVALAIVLVLTTVTTGIAADVSTSWGAEENMVESPPAWTTHLPETVQPGEYTAREDLRGVNEDFLRHGSEVEILVRGDITDPATLHRIERARGLATEQPAIRTLPNGEVRSTDPLRTMEQVASTDEQFAEAFEAADETGDGIPDTDLESLYEELFAVAPDRAADVLARENGNYVAYRLSMSVDPEADGREITDQADVIGGELEDEDVTVSTTGQPILGYAIQQELLDTLLASFALTLGTVLLVLLVVFRVFHGSATLGLVTLLPVTFGVSWIIATMTLLGYPLSVLNTIIASLTIGIGIDYSIHVSERFRTEWERTGTVEEALPPTVRGTGGALLGSASTTAIGFGVLALAIHPPLQQFGIITAIMIGYAFVGAIFVLPSLLVVWARFWDWWTPGERTAKSALARSGP